MSDDAATGASDSANGGNGEPQLEEVPRQTKSLTIGAVCKSLQPEFPDISISKIRYLEDQKLLTPRRTPGGYRLYSAADVSRRFYGCFARARGGVVGHGHLSAPGR